MYYFQLQIKKNIIYFACLALKFCCKTPLQICAAVAAFNVSLVTAMSACATNVVNLAKNITSNKNNCTVGRINHKLISFI